MTETTIRPRVGIVTRILVWVRRCQRELSSRIYAAEDERARRYGWTVTETTGRFGFAARSYRDPRFDEGRRQPCPGASLCPARNEAAPTRAARE